MSTAEAPSGLETVRAFLNTWEIPNDTRVVVDHLDALVADAQAWTRAMPAVPPPGGEELHELRRLRDDLRAALGRTHPTDLSGQLERYPLTVVLRGEADERAVALQPVEPRAVATLLALALTGVQEGRWHRLRACPDCRWVFYDTSRNASRVWCAMTSGPGARGCGAIAKTRAYRARRRT